MAVQSLALLSRFRSGAYKDAASLDFKADDIAAALARARNPNDHFDLLRLQGWYHYLRGEFEQALAAQIAAFAERPDVEGLKNIGILGRRLKDRSRAVDLLLDNEARFPDSPELYDVLAHNCGAFGDREGARRYGTRALALKDELHGRMALPAPLPPIAPLDPRRPAGNVIAFTLFGENPRYVQPLLISADLRQHLFPLWTLRIYVDNSVPSEVLNILRGKGCQVVMDGDEVPGTLRRFLVSDDPEVDRFIIRDADSLLNIRERVAVDAWLSSGRHFHVMRDFYTHTELILAGMWGGVRGALPSMRALISEWLRGQKHVTYNRATSDQIFLREKVWPVVRHSALVHDSWFDFGDKVNFPEVGTLPPWKHVGQNDFIFFKPSEAR
jgi:tetratricopeptide (TPR) repeat protein